MRDLEINGLTGEEETRRQYEYIEKARQYVAQKEKEAGGSGLQVQVVCVPG